MRRSTLARAIEECHIGCVLWECPWPEVARVFFCHILNIAPDYFWISVVVEFNICRGSYVSGFELVEGARGHSEWFYASLYEDNKE